MWEKSSENPHEIGTGEVYVKGDATVPRTRSWMGRYFWWCVWKKVVVLQVCTDGPFSLRRHDELNQVFRTLGRIPNTKHWPCVGVLIGNEDCGFSAFDEEGEGVKVECIRIVHRSEARRMGLLLL